eukprot:COSAG01_NODE_805_length_13443_cov_81.464928_13_plen_100_part_00
MSFTYSSLDHCLVVILRLSAPPGQGCGGPNPSLRKSFLITTPLGIPVAHCRAVSCCVCLLCPSCPRPRLALPFLPAPPLLSAPPLLATLFQPLFPALRL